MNYCHEERKLDLKPAPQIILRQKKLQKQQRNCCLSLDVISYRALVTFTMLLTIPSSLKPTPSNIIQRRWNLTDWSIYRQTAVVIYFEDRTGNGKLVICHLSPFCPGASYIRDRQGPVLVLCNQHSLPQQFEQQQTAIAENTIKDNKNIELRQLGHGSDSRAENLVMTVLRAFHYTEAPILHVVSVTRARVSRTFKCLCNKPRFPCSHFQSVFSICEQIRFILGNKVD